MPSAICRCRAPNHRAPAAHHRHALHTASRSDPRGVTWKLVGWCEQANVRASGRAGEGLLIAQSAHLLLQETGRRCRRGAAALPALAAGGCRPSASAQPAHHRRRPAAASSAAAPRPISDVSTEWRTRNVPAMPGGGRAPLLHPAGQAQLACRFSGADVSQVGAKPVVR